MYSMGLNFLHVSDHNCAEILKCCNYQQLSSDRRVPENMLTDTRNNPTAYLLRKVNSFKAAPLRSTLNIVMKNWRTTVDKTIKLIAEA